MFSRVLKPVANVATQNGSKNFSVSSQNNFKVVIAGAAGGIGQPLSLLMKLNPLVTHLSLYDVAPVTNGVACDLSHMNTCAKVTGHLGADKLGEAVKGADLVIMPAGVPRKPGMTRDDLFTVNATIVRDVITAIAKNAPKAMIAIITNPVNSMVPIAAEVMKKHCVFDPKRLLGVTTLDVVRACTFIGEINNVDPQKVTIPVIGGHAGITIIPVLSQSEPKVNLCDQKDIEALTARIQEAGTEVVKAKAGGGSATLSMAYAGARIGKAILKGLNGEKVVECAYVASDITDSPYFATPVVFGKCGIEKNLGYGKLNSYEKKLVEAAIPELLKNIEKAQEFVNKYVNKE